jgi:hypothetical protein
VRRNSILFLYSVAASSALCSALCSTTPLLAETTEEPDNLTLAEENFAYGMKTPADRVKAFLKVAETKFQLVKKNARSGSSTDLPALFNGYPTAIKGAWMGVSWAQALRIDTTNSIGAIQRTTKRHIDGLKKLRESADASQREALNRIIDTVVRVQSLESVDLYARR